MLLFIADRESSLALGISFGRLFWTLASFCHFLQTRNEPSKLFLSVDPSGAASHP
jgi:hypothetical protein